MALHQPLFVFAGLTALQLSACAANALSTEEIDEVVLALRGYQASAWLIGIVLIWADVALPVPQTVVIAALGIVYGTLGGGLLGSVGLVTGGLLGYALAHRFGRGPVARLVGERSFERIERLFAGGGMWAIVLTRSLPYSLPEAVVFVAGLAKMPVRKVLVALTVGSVPSAFAFSAIGAGWDEQPALALAVSYAVPIPLVPLALYLMRGRAGNLTRGPGIGTEGR
jgi:uncharacterized membrane protein YdjX (TVP38/TMEM64 family)